MCFHRTRESYYYLSAYLDVSSLLPTTPNTKFELLLYFNHENSLRYLDTSLFPTLHDYHQFYTIEPRDTITDVNVYSNPLLNQADFETNVAFDQVGVVWTETLAEQPTQIIPEGFLNVTQNPILTINYISCTLLDPQQVYIYAGGWGTITKFSAPTFQVNDVYVLPFRGGSNSASNGIRGGAMDPRGKYAYFVVPGTSSSTTTDVLKINLDTFTQEAVLSNLAISLVGSVNISFYYVPVVVFMDDPGLYLYIASKQSPAKIAKINLSTFTLVSILTLNSGENDILSGVITAGSMGYFATSNTPTQVVRVDLNTMTRTGVLTFNSGERYAICAVLDRTTNYAYFASNETTYSRLIKVDTSTSPNPTRVSATPDSLFLNRSTFLTSLALATGTPYVYGAYGYDTAQQVVQFDIAPVAATAVARMNLNSGYSTAFFASIYVPIVDSLFLPSSDVYFTTVTSTQQPSTVFQVQLQPMQLTQTLTLSQSVLFANCTAIDSTGQYMYVGSVQLYAAAKVAVAIKLDLSTYETVGFIQFSVSSTDSDSVRYIVLDSANQYGYFIVRSATSTTTLLYKVQLNTFTIVGSGTLSTTGTIDGAVIDRTNSFLYAIQYVSGTNRVYKFNLTTLTVVQTLSFPTVPGTVPTFASQSQLYIDPDNRFMYTGSFGAVRNCGVVFRFDLSTFTYTGYTSLATTATTWFMESSRCVYDAQGRFMVTCGTQRPFLSKLELSSTSLPVVVQQTPVAFPDSTYRQLAGFVAEPTGTYGYMLYISTLYTSFEIVCVNLITLENTVVRKDFTTICNSFTCTQVDPFSRFLYWVTTTPSANVVRVNLTNTLLSGLSTNSPTNLENTTEVTDIDYESQVAKVRSLGQNRERIVPRYVGLYLKGQTGNLVQPSPTPLTIHTRIKVYPN